MFVHIRLPKEVLTVARKTGVPTLLWIAEQLCKYLAKYSASIQILYPDNPALIAALVAATAACAELKLELAKVREWGD
jgi:hypothetical protein